MPPEVFNKASLILAPTRRSGRRPIRVENLINKAELYKRPSELKLAHNWLASQAAEHMTDLAGLSAMALSSADKLKASMSPEDNPTSAVGGQLGRDALDLGGLAVMAAPSVAAYRKTLQGQGGPHLAGGGSKILNGINLAGLSALAVPVADRIQAHLRGGEDKQILSDRTHHLLDVGGLATLAGGVAREHLGGRSDPSTTRRLLGGYSILAAPAAADLISHPDPNEEAKPNRLRPLSELAGLAMLASPTLGHLGHTKAAADKSDLEKSLGRLQKMEEDPPEAKQLGRYAMVGAAVVPVASLIGDAIEGSPLLKYTPNNKVDLFATGRRLAGKSITGAITSGFVPVLRHQLDRSAEIQQLRAALAKAEAPAPAETAAKIATALIPSGHTPAARLASSRRIGEPRMTNLEGPSLAQQSRTFGKVQPGTSKGSI